MELYLFILYAEFGVRWQLKFFSNEYNLGIQALGVLSYGIFCIISAMAIFQAVKAFMGLRVSEEEEILGLDIGEHDMESYAGFQIFSVE